MKQDRRIAKTRKAILEAFLQLTTQKDFKNITVKDITETADINRATFYYHFLDKYQVLDVLLEEQWMNPLLQKIDQLEQANEEAYRLILDELIFFQTDIMNTCQNSYEEYLPSIDIITERYLTEKLTQLFIKNNVNEQEAQIKSIFITGGILSFSKAYVRKQISDYNLMLTSLSIYTQ